MADAADQPPIRIGVTPAFLHDQHGLLEDWRDYLQRRLKRNVEFVPRDRYRDTMDLLEQGKLDYAWVCDYPYVLLQNTVRLLAAPVHEGKPVYRSYLIVSAKDKHVQSIADLQGAVFAYADPLSNTGYLAPRYMVREAGGNPADFFKRTFFTWSHRKAIEAVASGLAQGAGVDSFVWDSLVKVAPDLVARTRIVAKSPDYGFPPFVAHKKVGESEYRAMQTALTDMAKDEAGQRLLARLNIDGFTQGSPRLYAGVTEMVRAFGEQ